MYSDDNLRITGDKVREVTMKILPTALIVVAVLLLAIPVSAEYVVTGGGLVGTGTAYPGVSVFQFTATPGQSIQRIEYDLPIDTTVNITLYYGTGSVVTGYAVYSSYLPAAVSTSKVQLGPDENTYSEQFIDAQAAGYSLIKHVQWNGYAINRSVSGTETMGFTLQDPYYGMISNELVYLEIPDLKNNLVYGVSITSSQPIDLWVFTAETTYLKEIVAKTYIDTLFGFGQGILDIAYTIKDVTYAIFYWLKFIFYDNLVLTMALYFSVTMAWSAISSKGNIFKFYQKFFRLQKTMIEFILLTFNTIVQIFGTIINALKP